MITSEKLGVIIRERRKALGVTQEEVALTAGTGIRFVVDLEKGKETAQIGKILDILQSLGLELKLEPRS